ncbi:uncharacterized protein LOC125500757 [Athalia rosae]|uniref:uncharacterized protein LOC125500757 n=1 Tax=Athalia rosae TaxID=37344 RepID=UPI0020333261|nr:uncharacterized protein LOC125500757 [Athalia rosae]
MKLVFILLLCSQTVFTFTYAAPELIPADLISAAEDQEFQLDVEPQIFVDDDGHFRLRIVSRDGTTFEEEGIVLTDDKTGEEIVVSKKSTFSYLDENGKFVQLSYDVDAPDHSIDEK